MSDKTNNINGHITDDHGNTIAIINNQYEDNHKEFKSIQTECEQLRYKKMYDYGLCYQEHSTFGIIVRMSDKLARLNNLMKNKNNIQVTDEKIEDTLKDIANYAIMAVMEERRIK